MMIFPSDFNFSMMANKLSISESLKLAVGSSKQITFNPSRLYAFMISTIC